MDVVMNKALEEMTDRAREEMYISRCGVHCPVCDSDDIEGGPVEIDAGYASQEVMCNNCGADWVDGYTLTGYLHLNPGDRR